MSWTRRIPGRLDFGFRRAHLDWEHCTREWSMVLPVPGSRIHGHGDHLIAQLRDRGVFVVDTIDNPGPTLKGWRELGNKLVIADRGPSTVLPLHDRARRRLYSIDTRSTQARLSRRPNFSLVGTRRFCRRRKARWGQSFCRRSGCLSGKWSRTEPVGLPG